MIFSVQPQASGGDQKIYPLMKEAYEMGAWCFDLPSANHLKSLKELKHLSTDEALIGLCHVEVETGASFLENPSIDLDPRSSQRSGEASSLRI